ncbi:MAG: aspartate-semialdehyde dehydrogenase [Elusimicrobia bacterium]|nr:aspartate-semialdehyde dehydrogenase [Elusimicrobiota bacterium]
MPKGHAETGWSRNNLKKFFGKSSLIIDESAAFRLNHDVPLVVAEINGSLVKENPPKLIASPNCTTAVLVMALAPLLKHSPIKRAVAASYQAASGAGRTARDGFLKEIETMAKGKTRACGEFPYALAGNIFPQIGRFLESGFTEEEEKVMAETKKILEAPDLAVSATCVRVPVLRGHCLAVWVELEKPLPSGNLAGLYQNFPGITLKEPGAAPLEIAGQGGVSIGRLRRDPLWPNGLSLWVAGDNLLKGAAQNVLQIADLLMTRPEPA